MSLSIGIVSGCVIVERYINDSIISLYMLFSELGSSVGKMDDELDVRLIPGSISVDIGLALLSPKWLSICSM